MKILRHDQASFERSAKKIFARRPIPSDAVRELVTGVIADVGKRGDRAVLDLTLKFDKAKLTAKRMRVSEEELAEAAAQVSAKTKVAMRSSRANVTAFAKASLRKDWSMKNAQGAQVGEMFQPFGRVGVYVPGGTAPLVSTSIMTVAIAKAAGVPEIVVCTPPGADGTVNPNLLHALGYCGATEIYKIGGAQAIAAQALGTKTIAPADKIVGPGNSFVVEAKRQLFGWVAVDLLPGPSELLVLADSSARAEFVAADLLAQAEHGGDSQVAFITDSEKLLDAVVAEVNEQAKTLSRQGPIRDVLKKGTTLVLAKSLEQGIKLCNDFAPEHLSLITRRDKTIIPKITTSGAIYAGNYSAVAVGDFLAGPSHTLPTGGSGKSFPGITVDMFQRRTSVVKISEAAMRKSAPLVESFAAIEGLDAHGRSASIRVE